MNKGIKNTDNYFVTSEATCKPDELQILFFVLPIFLRERFGVEEDRADVRFYTAVLVLVVGSSSARQLSPD